MLAPGTARDSVGTVPVLSPRTARDNPGSVLGLPGTTRTVTVLRPGTTQDNQLSRVGMSALVTVVAGALACTCWRERPTDFKRKGRN